MALCGAHTCVCEEFFKKLALHNVLVAVVRRGTSSTADHEGKYTLKRCTESGKKGEKRGKKGKKYLYILQSLYSRVLLSPPCCFHPRAASPPCCFHPRAASPPCCFHPLRQLSFEMWGSCGW
ncbi:hypothetical protein POVWA2_044190 [Plasmodium ovale wallikeri]|uniref:Uncharacterized protein n=1 Tax=Plasmodium ovale wallikeri TaxID=864142 RepID=A0A1A8ZFI6_PLAOA|nr:hypothetical protein POVWA2_044190 [Plasmodium ovale wallikeri]